MFIVGNEHFIEYEYLDKSYLVTSEAYGSLEELKKLANSNDKPVIGSYCDGNNISVGLFLPGNIVVDKRLKSVSPPWKERVLGKHMSVIEYDDVKILPIICYEIVFPKKWCNFEGVDFVTHHVGFPMFDVFQYEAWKGLEQAVSIFYDCDVIVCCGGEKNEMNLTSIINKHTDFDFAHLYKKYGNKLDSSKKIF